MGMALMVAPKLMLLDEPTAGLSPAAAENLFEMVRSISADGVAIAMVEQNALRALMIADRAFILVDGRNARCGPAQAIAADPEIRRVFLGAQANV
jgi:branched-chain amino acid transport system ATP-binding protein/neutral amino acid transport system ATP-binding protein